VISLTDFWRHIAASGTQRLVTLCVPAGQCTGTRRRARATTELLHQETPNFPAPKFQHWPPNSPDLSLWITRSGLSCNIVSIRQIRSFSTDNVDFVYICYIQCDLFHCYNFNYEIMPTTLANTFLFILQGNALADLKYGVRFRVHLVVVNF